MACIFYVTKASPNIIDAEQCLLMRSSKLTRRRFNNGTYEIEALALSSTRSKIPRRFTFYKIAVRADVDYEENLLNVMAEKYIYGLTAVPQIWRILSNLYRPVTSPLCSKVDLLQCKLTMHANHSLMVFMKKKRVKFAVELEILRLTDVPLLNATLFAKIRLMDGGNFEEFTKRKHVTNFSVRLEDKFSFLCRIPADVQTGELEDCRCKISVRKEDRLGRAPQKLGYVIVNLSEFAASGVSGLTRSYLLDGYSGKNRQDNSRVHIHVKMIAQGSDPLYKVPFSAINSLEEAHLNPADRKAPASAGKPPVSSALDDVNGDSSPAIQGDVEEKTPSVYTASTSSANSHMDRASWHGGTTTGTTPSDPISIPTIAERRILGTSATSLIHNTRRMSDDRINPTMSRVQKTRRDAEGVIEEVLAETHLEARPNEPRQGLALQISDDGTPILASETINTINDTTKTLGDSTLKDYKDE